MSKRLTKLSVFIAAAFATQAFAAQVTCSSTDGKYRECPLDGSGDIVMKQQLSKTDCVKNKNWGETAEGVYVKGGCRAIFETMSSQPQRTSGGNGFRDLIGAKAAGGETELNARGYEYVNGETRNGQKVTYWWTPGRRSCIEVTTSDGRYSNIRDVGKGECY